MKYTITIHDDRTLEQIDKFKLLHPRELLTAGLHALSEGRGLPDANEDEDEEKELRITAITEIELVLGYIDHVTSRWASEKEK